MKRPHALSPRSGLTAALAAPALAQNFGPPELIAAAKKEGRLVFYTANFAEVEQEVIKAFNKRFPEIKVEMVRAPGGQLITRIKTEAAAGKLAADVVNHSDRGLMLELENLFMDYAPPNAADYLPDVLVSPKLWPQATLGLGDRLQLRDREESAEELDGSDQARIQGQADRPDHRAIGRHHLDPDHVRAPGAGRGLLEEAGRDRGRCCFPPARRPPTRWCAAKSRSRRSLYNIVFTKQRDGAPVEIVFAPEGMPINPYAAGIPATREESERRQAVPQLVPLGRGPGLHDQGAGQPDLAQESRRCSPRATIPTR